MVVVKLGPSDWTKHAVWCNLGASWVRSGCSELQTGTEGRRHLAAVACAAVEGERDKHKNPLNTGIRHSILNSETVKHDMVTCLKRSGVNCRPAARGHLPAVACAVVSWDLAKHSVW